MSIIDTLITDRKAGSFYHAEDLNRLSAAIYYIANFLSENGYPSPIAENLLPTNRTAQDYFYAEDGDLILTTMEQLRTNFGSLLPSKIPSAFSYLDYIGANQLEQFLLDIHNLLIGSTTQILQCGTFSCE